MSTEGTSKPSIKVTDRRLFTEEGELRDSSVSDVSESTIPGPEESRPDKPQKEVAESSRQEERPEPGPSGGQEASTLDNPGTLFTNFLDSLVVNTYMALGMVRHPYKDEPEIDVQGARQMIDIIEMLGEKTKGNLTAQEAAYLSAHLGELKLAFVRRSQSI